MYKLMMHAQHKLHVLIPVHICLQAVANKVAAVENCKAAMVTSSGMAAISSTLLTLLKSQDHMLVQESLYGGTEMLLTHDLPDWGIAVTRVNADKPETWRQHLKPNTKVAPAAEPARCLCTLLSGTIHLTSQLPAKAHAHACAQTPCCMPLGNTQVHLSTFAVWQ